MKTEFRFAEFRAEGDTLTGVAIRYGDTARIGPFTERFEPGSITVSPDAVARLQHDRRKPVARIGAGLTFDNSDRELRATINLPDTTYAREARELVSANILRGFSIEFQSDDSVWNGMERVVRKATVVGIGIVDTPAYKASEIALRMEEERASVAAPPRRRIYV